MDSKNETSAMDVDVIDIGWLAFFLAVNRYPENPMPYVAGYFSELEDMEKRYGDRQ